MGGPEMAPQLVQARGLRPLGLPGQRSGRPGGAVTALDRALEAAARARVTLILGTSDTGKTSLTARLAGALAARGERVAVVDADVGRSAARRREHRERALRDYLARAATLTLPTARAPVRDRRGEALTDVAEGLLLGVLGAGGETLGIARVRAWDAARGRIVVDTPVLAEQIAALVAGRATWRA